MRITPYLLSSLALLTSAACGDSDGGANGNTDGGNGGTTNGSETNGNGGTTGGSTSGQSTNGGPCGKGDFPDEQYNSTYSFCADPEDDECLPLSAAKDYTAFPGEMYVHTVTSLEDLSCMESAANLTIAEVSSLVGLERLEWAGDLTIIDNPDLTNLKGISGLKEAEILYFANNGLTTLEGLPAGLVIGELYIDYSENLTSLKGLENVTVTDRIGIGNTSVPQCEVEKFAARFPNLKGVNIEGNMGTGTCN